MENFKIRVVKNIGEDSESTFGKVGNELDVVDGKLTDLDGYEWAPCFYTIEEINEHFFADFKELSWFDTVFELVESGESNE